MTKPHRLGIALLVVISVVVCDRITKNLAIANLSRHALVPVWEGIVTLEYTENLGAFLGLGARLPAQVRTVFGIGVTGVFIIAAVVYAIRTRDTRLPQLISLSCVVGGGIGNLIDRIWNGGAVPDFVVLSLGPLHTGVFNLADVAVTLGALAFAWIGLREEPKHSQAQHGKEPVPKD